MKKIGVIVKEISEKKIKSSLKDADSFFVVKYSGLSSLDLTALRMSLKGVRANLFVVKNTVARRVLKDTGCDSMIKNVEGPCGFIFSKEEPVEASKVLCNFSKEHEKIKLEAAFLQDKVLTEDDIKAMAKLPGKEALRAQLVYVLNTPISGLAMVLNQTLKKFVVCLEQIRKKKEEQSK